MSHLTYTVRIPPEREAKTDRAIRKYLMDFPQGSVDDALDHIFKTGVFFTSEVFGSIPGIRIDKTP